MYQEFVIRPLTSADLNWLYTIADNIGPGFTSLQHAKTFLTKRLEIVEKSFNERIPTKERIFLFVRENLSNHELVGLAGLIVNVGHHEPFYNFQVSTITQTSIKLDITATHQILNLVTNFQQASELISFWVHPNYRGHDVGKSLSLSRFLFIKQFSSWFATEIIAEIRGICDEQGNSPFWDAIGSKFFRMDFREADYLTMISNKQFMSDLSPHEPIYVDLLSDQARNVIGCEHPHSKAARHVLEEQGFKYSHHIDIFDGGPLLVADQEDIVTIKDTMTVKISDLGADCTQGVHALIYNNQLKARISVGKLLLCHDQQVVIEARMAEILQVKIGDTISYCPIQY